MNTDAKVCRKIDQLTNEIELMGEALKFNRSLNMIDAINRKLAAREALYQYLDNQIRLLHLLSQNRYDNFQKSAALVSSRLEALSPLAVMARGYSVARTVPGKKILRSVAEAKAGDLIETVVRDGSLFSAVEKAERKKSEK